MVTAAQQIDQLPEGGFVYEPRSFWDIVSEPLEANAQHFRFNREFFRNGQRWPITLTRAALLGVGYTFQIQPNNPGFAFRYQSIGSALSAAQITISSPFRQHYGKNARVLSGARPSARWQPLPADQATPVGTVSPSSMWGQCNLDFDRPLYLPRGGYIEWALSAIVAPGETQLTPVHVHMLYQEEGGLFVGSARSFTFDARRKASTDTYPQPPATRAPIPQQRWPFPPDAFVPLYEGPADTADFWQGDGDFNAKEFIRQEATRAGSTKMLGMRTVIDQIAYDQAILATLPFPADFFPIAPISTRIGTRVKTTSGGSDTKWWRDGAPLALVFDSVTPAAVFQFERPITLQPGDSLEVELVLPGVPNLPQDEYDRLMTVGLALNGYAAIEG